MDFINTIFIGANYWNKTSRNLLEKCSMIIINMMNRSYTPYAFVLQHKDNSNITPVTVIK